MAMAKTRSTSTSVLIGVGFLLFALGLLAGVHLSRPSISRRMNDDLNNDLNGRNLRQRGLQYLDPRTVSLKPSSLSVTAPNSGFTSDQRQVQQQLPFQQLPEFQPQQPKIRVSYVTSFWAKVRRTEMHPHRKEVEAALLANIHNPHFDQVVIFLDIGSEKGSEVCQHFRRTMKDLSLRLLPSTTKEEVNELLYSKLTCVDLYSGQPNYYQMFQNAVSDHVRGDVVVLANADMAFDDTISLARHLNPEVIAALGTRGFSDETPQHLKFIYTQMMDGTAQKSSDADKCAADTRWSWDTWIFHKSKIKGRMRPEDFKRLNQNHKSEFFYMNENGAENAALWAVQQSYPFTSLYNACEKIYSWSFHLTSKTHQEREIPWMQRGKRSGVVPSPWKRMNRTPECFQANNCFISLPPSST